MEVDDAVVALSALAQGTRLDVFRALVKAGGEGMSAGGIASALGVAPATLSFHLKELSRAGLIHSERDGRSVIYQADFTKMKSLVDFLTEDCCGGHPDVCGPFFPEGSELKSGGIKSCD